MFRKDQQIISEESGRTAHATEVVVCSITRRSLLLDESGVSAISGRLISRTLLKASEKPPNRLGIDEEFVVCKVSGKRLLKDEALSSSVSGKWIDRDLVARSAFSGQPAMPDELVRCDVSGEWLLPSETSVSDVSGRRARNDLMRYSSKSQRAGIKDECGHCEFTKQLLLVDEMFRSDVSGRYFSKDELVRSIESGKMGHRSEMVECHVPKGPICPDESGVSSVSRKTCSKSRLVESEKSPGQFGLPDEMRVCEATQKRILKTEAIKSAVSGKWFDSDLTEASARSKSRAWWAELVICDITGAKLLPAETDICGITDQRVDKALLAKSGISGRPGIKTKMEICPRSGKRAFPSELRPCEVTGERVDPAELSRCTVSGKTAINGLFVQSNVSASSMLRDLAVVSPSSKRLCMPSESVLCTWDGALYPSDEVARCTLTSLTFSQGLVNDKSEMKILRALLDGKELGEDGRDDLTSWLPSAIKMTSRIETVRYVVSPNNVVRAVCAESRTRLGFKVRHIGLFVRGRGTLQKLGRIVIGKRDSKVWSFESIIESDNPLIGKSAADYPADGR